MSFNIRYKGRIPTWRYGEMIVCHCAGVTDMAIVQMARDGATSVAEIGRRTGAGQCCAPCRREIAAILVDVASGGADQQAA